MPKVTVEKNRCKGCALCVAACPQRVLDMSKDINQKGYFFATPAKQNQCIGCQICAITCPDVAITVGVQGTRYHYFEY